jgi:hypothetical protein
MPRWACDGGVLLFSPLASQLLCRPWRSGSRRFAQSGPDRSGRTRLRPRGPGPVASGHRRTPDRPGFAAGLVAGEVALALVLLIGAGLLLKDSGARLACPPVSIRSTSLCVAGPHRAPARSIPREARRLRGAAGERSQRLRTSSPPPSHHLPLRGLIAGSQLAPTSPRGADSYSRHGVTPRFFETLGIPILAGRPSPPVTGRCPWWRS